MSNIFSKYQKELAGVRVASSNEVWLHTKNGRPYLNPKYDVIGKVTCEFPNFILKANKKGCKTGYIEDTSALTKITKSELVDYFHTKKGNRNRRTTAYLVRLDNKYAGGSGVVRCITNTKSNN